MRFRLLAQAVARNNTRGGRRGVAVEVIAKDKAVAIAEFVGCLKSSTRGKGGISPSRVRHDIVYGATWFRMM